MSSDVVVTDNPEASRWEAHVHGALAGVAEYQRTGEVVTFTHTEVGSEFGGQGIAGQLARASLDAARAAGHRVRPACPYYAGWIAKHPDYQDLVAT